MSGADVLTISPKPCPVCTRPVFARRWPSGRWLITCYGPRPWLHSAEAAGDTEDHAIQNWNRAAGA